MMTSFIADTDSLRKRCFAPIADDRTTLLILGSLPGDKSLALQQYYGNPQNRFWMLMSEVLGADLTGMAYAQRLLALQERGVGLWDVVAEARRPGSLDSQIRDLAGNDLAALVEQLPALRALAFNGGTAAKLGLKALGPRATRLATVALPSSSGAHTMPYAEKRAAWMVLQAHVRNARADS